MASHSLPSRALTLIREYSKPFTRPDWRRIHLMTTFSMYTDLRKKRLWGKKNFWRKLYSIIMYNIEETYWFIQYVYVLKSGIDTYINNHKLSSFEILQIEKLQRDIIQYKKEVIRR
uniref:Uncharacterized protein n=1 Tax=viral metagenome TaxID=1070528 RepID=A0A6C0JKI2_9ZZZZ